jgi:hypothetical protein
MIFSAPTLRVQRLRLNGHLYPLERLARAVALVGEEAPAAGTRAAMTSPAGFG